MFDSARKRARLQSAMEYLMTYGWAILIIAVVLGALFQLGVFNSSSFSPRAPPGACQVFRPSGPGTTQNINMMGVCTGQLPQYVAQFNGASSYVTVLDSALNSPTNAVTVSGWFYYKQIGKNVGLIWKSAYNYDLYTGEGGVVKFTLWNASDTSTQARFDEVLLKVNGWNYITGTYDGTSTILYLNGQQTGIIGNTAKFTIRDQAGDLVVGKRGDSAGDIYFNGLISNVQIYDSSLTANQIQALYLEGIGGAPMKLQNLVGWWPLNGNANDYSGNNNNGVPTSVTFTSQYGK